MKHAVLTALALSGAVTFSPAPAPAQQGTWPSPPKQIDTAFAFAKTGTVLLGDGAAEIIVVGWDQPTIQVAAKAEGGIKMDGNAMKLVIASARPQDMAIIKLMVPRGVSVVARTRSGAITVKETRGDVDIETTSGKVLVVDARDVEATNLSGDLDVYQATGSVTLSANNGDCTVTDVKGNISASSVSGDVKIKGSHARIVRGETTNGSISFEGAVHDGGRYEFVTHSGSIWLAVPKTSNAQLGITTWSGAVESDFPVMLRPGFTPATAATTKRYTFTLGQGLARVTAETFSGDVSITASGGR